MSDLGLCDSLLLRLLVFVAMAGDPGNRSTAVAFRSSNGLRWSATGGSYVVDADCSQAGLLSHPKFGWLSFQRVLQVVWTWT